MLTTMQITILTTLPSMVKHYDNYHLTIMLIYFENYRKNNCIIDL